METRVLTEAHRLDRAINRVVRSYNCSGCGACTLLDAGLTMRLDAEGYNRPVRDATLPAAPRPQASKTFQQICPGRRVRSPRPPTASVHPTMGPVVSAWEAWAADPDFRRRGSSGGVLSAMMAWLTESGEVCGFATAMADRSDPTRTTPARVRNREQALAAAGSRYAPVSVLADVTDTKTSVAGKPCEISAMRALLTGASEQRDDQAPLLLSFFCAGTPSQHATHRLLGDLGASPTQPLRDMWYRGRGWPGRFTAVRTDGTEVSASYDESWGKALGPTLQWRCKICPDGVGASSDITAADLWHADEDGYPVFNEGDGVSALIARTPRGHDVVERALQAGVLVGRPLDVARLAQVQPFQVTRRTTLLGRLVGTLAAGRGVPRLHGFGLTRLSLRNARESIRVGRGSFRRVKAATRDSRQ